MDNIRLMKKSYIWNTIAGLINASEAVILLMIVTRTNSLGDAGILTIAFAVGNLMMTIGKFGMHNFQVTDIENKYSYHTYAFSRAVTVFLMGLSSVAYVLFGICRLQYSRNKAICIFLICGIYMVEAMEDVVWCKYQKIGRLDVGAKIFSCRWISILISVSIVLLISSNLVYALIVAVLMACFAECILVIIYRKKIRIKNDERVSYPMTCLIKDCLPLFLAGFFDFYLINAPKYAIDACMTDEKQACYGFVAMPVFVIGLLNGFIYQPIIVKMACEWREGNINKLKKRVWNQTGIIFLITIICEVGAWWVGIPTLSLLYNTDLTTYKPELLILLMGGGNLAFIGFFITTLTIMRCQKNQLYGYLFVTVISFLTVKNVVYNYGTLGAAGIYCILTFMLAIILFMLIFWKLRERDTR